VETKIPNIYTMDIDEMGWHKDCMGWRLQVQGTGEKFVLIQHFTRLGRWKGQGSHEVIHLQRG
jgi:hypothetical protein